MTCKGCIQVVLKILNFLVTLVGLAMIGYGVYMFVKWDSRKHSTVYPPPPPVPLPPLTLPPADAAARSGNRVSVLNGIVQSSSADAVGMDVLQLRKVLYLKVATQDGQPSFFKFFPQTWFIYLFIGAGVIICLITCSGYIAAASMNGCCLSCYTIFVGLFIILELALAGFIFFNHNWEKDIPEDPTGQLGNIEDFIKSNFRILKWVALAIVILEGIAILLSLILRALNSSRKEDYDSDDDYVPPRSGVRQPLLNRQGVPGATASPAGGSESWPVRTDAWSTRMREKYGLDTTEFTYNPTESRRFAPQTTASVEERKCKCMIM
eukprot:c21390_g1_i1 orf=303-1268(-)